MSSSAGAVGVICLGASAGGLRSLEAIVSRLPTDLPWPVLIAQHLQTDRVSQMAAILARVANMPVRDATDGETPQAGTIYTCPSSHEMGLSMEGQITLRPPSDGKPRRVDHLFATASYARPGRTIAVVLSGTGSDGAVGSLVVKLNHGTVIAESDASAQYAAMPAAAERAGSVDATLAADAIAALLDNLARGALDDATGATMAVVDEIARHITEPGGTDFAHYRASTLRRQASKRRAILGLRTLADYRDRVAAAPSERKELIRSLLIPVTEFFRDAAAWRAIEDDVVPLLARKARAGEPVRVWCAGCASGEEAYSIAILLAESIADRSDVQVLATDLDADSVARARVGAFDASRMARVDDLRRERFFQAEGHAFRANDDLRRMLQFRVHDVTREEPPGQFDLIVCRNVLIYFDDQLQARTLAKLQGALAGPQLLFLGRSEALPRDGHNLVAVSRSLRIFRASGDAAGSTVTVTRAPTLDAGGHGMWSDASDVRVEEPDAIVLVVDDAWQVLSANDHARTVLEAVVEDANLFDLFPRWQGSPVQDALRACSETGRSLKVRGAPTPQGAMDITFERAPGAHRATLLIGTPSVPRVRRAVESTPAEREELAASNDELQTANEELAATNEELAATNEELQATNEELASLNEEFQTTNQTLAATNVELDTLAKSARAATDLIFEYMQARFDALVACDASKRITMVNRTARDLFQLDASCLGQAVALAGLGLTEPEVEAFFARAVDRPHTRIVAHAGGTLELTVEHVRAKDARTLGWVLSWSRTSS